MEFIKANHQQTIGVKYFFTDEEKKEFAEELTGIIGKISDLEHDKKDMADSFKKKIDGLEIRKSELARQYRTGYEIRDMLAELYLDFENNERVWRNAETFETVRIDPLLPEDRQLKLELKEAVNE